MIGNHVLKKNHKNVVPETIVFFDTESHVKINLDKEEIGIIADGNTIKRYHEHYLTCAIFLNKGQEDKRIYYKETLNDFWHDVTSINEKKIYVFSHNAKYDTLVTNAVKYLYEYGYKIVGFSDDNPFIMRWKGKNEIIILSSTNYYKTSIKELGKTFGLEKLGVDYEGDNEEKEIEYCMRDVEILKTAMMSFINFVKRQDLGNFSMTIAGQAFNAYRHRFMNADIYIHRNVEIVQLERKAYAGGRNEAFSLGKYNKHVTSYDVNSMYPAVMLENKYPVKLISVRKNINVDDLKSILDKGFLAIAECEVDTKEPVFFKKDKKLIFPIGRFITYLSTPELIYGIENDLIKKVNLCAIYEGKNIFENYVTFFYNERMKAKKAKDEVHTMLYKLFLNSLYGKFGQKNIVWEKIADTDENVVKEDKVFDIDLWKYRLIKIFGGSIFEKKEDIEGYSEATNAFCAIAAHVTAYARMKLWQFMKSAELKNVLYCDTDSLFVNDKGRKNLEKSGLVDDYKLGYIKKEKEDDFIIINGCKDYVFMSKVKLKGVKNGSIKISDNKYICQRWEGYSNFIKENNQRYYTEYFLKELKREYDKGKKTIFGRVKPFKLHEW